MFDCFFHESSRNGCVKVMHKLIDALSCGRLFGNMVKIYSDAAIRHFAGGYGM